MCAILENRCVELAAGVQVYSDPASTLRTMAHNHSASQDVVLTAIQQSSGKPQSPTLMDLDIQDRGYQLRRIPLPRTWVNKGEKRGRRPSLGGIIEVHRDIEQGVRSYDPPTSSARHAWTVRSTRKSRQTRHPPCQRLGSWHWWRSRTALEGLFGPWPSSETPRQRAS